jgi:aconitate hydratase
MFGVPKAGDLDFTRVVHLDLSTVTPSLAGPKRPQDRIEIGNVKSTFTDLFSKPTTENGFNKKADDLTKVYETSNGVHVKNGDILIAAITSCTNTSNPSVLLAAGLLAKKAVEAGLTVAPHIKSSLAPGSRVVTEYLTAAGLLPYLEKLGFGVTAYGCTTCIGNAGDLTPELNATITTNDIVAAAVLSGNRNFEARIHPNIRELPGLAAAGRRLRDRRQRDRDLMTEPVGKGSNGKDVYLGDIWPTSPRSKLMKFAMNSKSSRPTTPTSRAHPGKLWEAVSSTEGQVYNWPESTYIAEPPFFSDFEMTPKAAASGIAGARALGVFGDSITTDHISPAGSIKEDGPAGKWLKETA